MKADIWKSGNEIIPETKETVRIEITEGTAIWNTYEDEDVQERVPALLWEEYNAYNELVGSFIVFNHELPKTWEEAMEIEKNADIWDFESDCKILESFKEE